MSDDKRNDLEAELRNLAPLPASADLRDRIAQELDADLAPQPVPEMPDTRGRRAIWLAAALVFLVAVGLVLWRRTVRDEQPGPQPGPRMVVQDVDTRQDMPDSPPPTLWAYRLAAAESPQQLDLLLDQHARVLLLPDDDLMCARDQIP
jgi:hypothetical protein